jgi:hypothetical protein
MPLDLPATQEIVLVVHVNPAVGAALAQRLVGSAVVVLAGVEAAVAGLSSAPLCDVVVLCPYLSFPERTALLEACLARDPRPAVLELMDEPGAGALQIQPVALAEV